MHFPPPLRLLGSFFVVFFFAVSALSADDVANNTYLPPGEPPVRVRLSVNLQKVSLEGYGFQVHGRESAIEKVALPKRQNLSISRDQVNGKNIWRVQRSGSAMDMAPIEIVTDKFLSLRAIDIRQGGKSVPNQLIFSPRGKFQFDVIGVLPLEAYLVGVLASEMPLAWPLETLKAQAIAARSYALATMKERAKEPFHLESSILDQVFVHISHHVDESPMIAKAKEAVLATEGMLLHGKNHQIVKAFYHSDCGGRTVSSVNVWGSGTSMGTAVDESCPTNPKAQWNLSLTKEEVLGKLQALKKFKFSDTDEILGIRVSKNAPEDRVQKVEISFVESKPILMAANEFRATIGYEQLRSTLFSILAKKESGKEVFVFSGKGFGHGVGLCQWGARALGRQGKSYTDILEHYYPRAQLFIPKLISRNSPERAEQTR